MNMVMLVVSQKISAEKNDSEKNRDKSIKKNERGRPQMRDSIANKGVKQLEECNRVAKQMKLKFLPKAS